MRNLILIFCTFFVFHFSAIGKINVLPKDSIPCHKTLRITLAMGGGVSLGSFSGAALTESLKLLLLYGQNECGEPYEEIVLDGMSGASAGAMSLAIMLKTLMDYEGTLSILDKSEDEIKDEIDALYGTGTCSSLNERKEKQLIALQAAQDLQKKVWVDELELDRLYGKKIKADYVPELDKTFSLLSSQFLKTLATKYILNNGGSFKIDNIQILNNERFIMAASLSNLAPIKPPFVSPRVYKKSKLVNNLFKSVATYNHKEVRV